MPDISDKAPDFTLPLGDGGEITLSALQGAPVVLFFYPRDDTPGCTTEATAFTSLLPEFDASGVKVIGISKDSVAKHAKFADKHGLTVPLASDEHGSTCEDYGVWQEKKMYGKTFMGIERSTFLIAKDGTIARIWPKVKVAGHAEDVLEAARSI
ncbi:peroxiredoxin [Roseovarius nanhaiticus]|uniref:thioredoxin-dependent peroxiredoxin n=1 Tax=Roseovarius nanhaiticus TaxID=573024 RepID=A0A1N7G6E3_9RHOB|nr:peroxiredoxin [Roseovarius nanhaiticus]SEK36245.1 peroxiredoxin Q/BCP [Roseovarius nanhaiticus]SIS08006.1 peroxiredoxin Q/BCP [Roseovarius nanhaiticus]